MDQHGSCANSLPLLPGEVQQLLQVLVKRCHGQSLLLLIQTPAFSSPMLMYFSDTSEKITLKNKNVTKFEGSTGRCIFAAFVVFSEMSCWCWYSQLKSAHLKLQKTLVMRSLAIKNSTSIYICFSRGDDTLMMPLVCRLYVPTIIFQKHSCARDELHTHSHTLIEPLVKAVRRFTQTKTSTLLPSVGQIESRKIPEFNGASCLDTNEPHSTCVTSAGFQTACW